MKQHKVGNDLITLRATIRRNFQTYKPGIAATSAQMFWVSIAITLSFLISQAYLIFMR